ncbi:Prim-Pol domain-containing protein, partial [Durusdinium trenchii]
MTIATDGARLQEAIRLAELGYPVFPLEPERKEPWKGSRGCNDATTDEDQIAEWHDQNPRCNFAVATSGLLVIDVDPLDSREANPWVAAHEATLRGCPTTITPRDGRHFWFRQPAGANLTIGAGDIADHVDHRGTGGYVVVPPSYVDDGKSRGRYQWLPGCDLDCTPDALPECPHWIIDAIEARKTERQRQESEPGEIIPERQRNSTLTRIAGYMRRGGLTESEILATLRRVNIERVRPPLDDAELRQIAWSVSRYEPDQIEQATIEGWHEQWVQPQSTDETDSDPGPFPERLLTVPGFIGDVVAHNLSTAYKPQPELALAGALALQATLVGRKVRDEFNTRPNVYIFGVCPSGGGKEHARQLNKEILFRAGLDDCHLAEDIASHAGILSALAEHPVQLFQIDEAGRLLKTLGNPDKSHLYQIISVLLKLFSSSGSQYRGIAYADMKQRRPIVQPHANLYCTTVPGSLHDALTAENLTDGFIGRLMIFYASDSDPDPQHVPHRPVSDEIVKVAEYWRDFRPGGNLSDSQQAATPLVIHYTDEASECVQSLEADARAIRKAGDEGVAGAWVRVVEKARKLALLYACSADHEKPRIDLKAAQWGCDVSRYLTEQIVHIANLHVAENQNERDVKRVYRIIRAAGSDGIKKSELTRKTQWLPNARRRDEILHQLGESGQVGMTETKTATRPTRTYIDESEQAVTTDRMCANCGRLMLIRTSKRNTATGQVTRRLVCECGARATRLVPAELVPKRSRTTESCKLQPSPSDSPMKAAQRCKNAGTVANPNPDGADMMLMRTPDVACWLDLTIELVDLLRERGELPFMVLDTVGGAEILYSRPALERWLADGCPVVDPERYAAWYDNRDENEAEVLYQRKPDNERTDEDREKRQELLREMHSLKGDNSTEAADRVLEIDREVAKLEGRIEHEQDIQNDINSRMPRRDIRQNDSLPRNAPAQFKNVATGEAIQAYQPHENLTPPESDIHIGRFVQGLLTGDTSGLSNIEAGALHGGSDSGGGYIVPTSMSTRVVDLARSASVALRAGVQTLPMTTAEMAIARLTQDPTAHWRPETVA